MKGTSITAILWVIVFVAVHVSKVSASSCSTTSLTDLEPTAQYNFGNSHYFSVNEWGEHTTMLMGDGNTYSEFIVIHPSLPLSYAEWNLDKAYASFTAVIGLALSTNACADDNYADYKGDSQFKFYLDSVLVHEKLLETGDDFELINLDVSDADVLRIETIAGDETTCDHDTVANPMLLCNECNATEFVWEDLMESESGKPEAVATLSVDETTLLLQVDITADYLGFSAADDNGYVYGTTYVVDFEDFDAHGDNIREPGTCQNRDETAFSDTSLSWDDIWEHSTTPNTAGHVGSDSYLAYPPGNKWSVAMTDGECSVEYSATFTWSELTTCTGFEGSGGSYINTQDNANNITLSGTLYINVVSPYDYAVDYGYYRVYQLLSQPFMIVVSKTTYVLGKVGINLLTMDMIAVYKEDEENTFRLIVLTEAAEYLELSRDTLGETTSLFQVFVPSDSSNPITSSNFRMLEPAETATSGCLGNKQYICSQLWQITADDVECTTDGIFTDFSGTYSIQFTPQCRSAADLGGDTALVTYCDGWLADHLDEITDSTADDTVLLSAGLSWRDEICDPLIFEVQFTASMQFYTDAAFSNEVADPYLFQAGEDEIYVKVTTDYPTTTLSVFATELLNVWICTFDPLVTPDEITVDSQEGGCFDSDADDNSENFFEHIYGDGEKEGFELDTSSSLESNEIQFFFTVPPKVHRDTLYIHAQIEVSLSNGRRRRMLLKADVRARAEEANQIDHFVNKVGVGSTPHDDHKPFAPDDHNYPQQPFEAPQAPISPPSQPWVINISLQSPWLIAVGCLLAVVLTVNIIFMCYTNCVQPNGDGFVSFSRRPKYKQVAVDSEEFSEHDAINVLSN